MGVVGFSSKEKTLVVVSSGVYTPVVGNLDRCWNVNGSWSFYIYALLSLFTEIRKHKGRVKA